MSKNKEVKNLEWLNYNNAIRFLIILALVVIIKTALTSTADLEQEAEIVLNTLINKESNELIVEKVRNLDEMSYDEIKSMLGIRRDFCIFLEDVSGNIVQIDNLDNLAIGSEKIYINGEQCK
ncbi:MAG: hypothetical protein V1831_00245 [Candidatus Woesearchaeota archaeon]